MSSAADPSENHLFTIERHFRSRATYPEILQMDALVLQKDLSDEEKSAQITTLVNGTQGTKQS